MSRKTEHFSCPCCGQHAPIERITEEGPFQFALFIKTIGGREKLSAEEKEKQISYGYRRFHVPGKLDYDPIPMDKDMLEAMQKRIEELKVE